MHEIEKILVRSATRSANEYINYCVLTNIHLVIFTARKRCGQRPPRERPPGQRPPRQRPPRTVKSGRYASYWNAVLFQNILDLNVLGGDIFNCEPLTGKQVQHSATWYYVRTEDIYIEILRYLYKYWTSGST